MQASIGQYSIHAGEPAQPVQQSVVMARMRGLFLRVALPSPTDMGQYFSTISNIISAFKRLAMIRSLPLAVLTRNTLTQAIGSLND